MAGSLEDQSPCQGTGMLPFHQRMSSTLVQDHLSIPLAIVQWVRL